MRYLFLALCFALSCKPVDGTGPAESDVDADADGYAESVDCNDDDASIHPFAPESCDGVDQDCDGSADGGATTRWYRDGDVDGYGTAADHLDACDAPEGFVPFGTDCDDANADIHPGADEVDCSDPTDYDCNGSTGFADDDLDGVPACEDCDDDDPEVAAQATFYRDTDGDGWGVEADHVDACTAPEGYAAELGDCDDADGDTHPYAVEDCVADDVDRNCDGSLPTEDKDADGARSCEECNDGDDTIYPGATEVCNGLDEDCDGAVDDGAIDAATWFRDVDGDGFGIPTDTALSCDRPAGYVASSSDCADGDATSYPGADELCDATDHDCDGDATADAVDTTVWYRDVDLDGFGDPGDTVDACTKPSGYVVNGDDCDDGDGDINPDVDELCDGVDDDCDGTIDEDDALDAVTWYRDVDGDGYGVDTDTHNACSAPTGYVGPSGDCDDGNTAASPALVELCATPFDDDCDGSINEDDASDALDWYADGDDDGFGDAADATTACEVPDGYVSDDTDCDDTADLVNPSAAEACDALDVDEDCDGFADDADAAASGETTWYVDLDGDDYGISAGSVTACDPSGTLTAAVGTDCNDAASTIHPGATEVCDASSTDEDCNGSADDGDSGTSSSSKTSYYADADSDGYGAGTASVRCHAGSGYTSTSGLDCNDGSSAINPGATEICDASDTDEDCDSAADDADSSASTASKASWYADADGDTYGAGTASSRCDAGGGYTTKTSGDCDDSSSSIRPGGTEVCDTANADEDCDTLADDADSSASTASKSSFYADGDADGYGAGSASSRCDAGGGYTSSLGTDCNDAITAINPGATEVCDASDTDEDCDALADDADSSVSSASKASWYADGDTDGYGAGTASSRCDAGGGYTTKTGGDCADAISAINPGATEICDGSDTDEDCDLVADDADTSTSDASKSNYYADGDGDSYGGGTASRRCDAGAGYSTTVGTDCNDASSAISPAATEICDASNTDEDCDTLADDADSSASSSSKTSWYADGDSDGYGAGTPTSRCDAGGGYTTSTATDCNDSLASINPAATEVCDGSNADEDCDTLADDADSSVSSASKTSWYADGDSDGYGAGSPSSRCDAGGGYPSSLSTDCNDLVSSVNPGATETCDASDTDEDCDTLADDADSAASGKSSWYADGDGDGYGAGTASSRCDANATYKVTVNGDCADGLSAINPGATEVCDASDTDEDCDTLADDADASASSGSKTTFYLDGDGDGYGGTTTASRCDASTSYKATSTDCDDSSSSINPGGTEVCDAANADEDCDTLADDADSSVSSGTKTSWYADGDSDGYGAGSASSRCDAGGGYTSSVNTDCADSISTINPGAAEASVAASCDGIDNDCSSATYATVYSNTFSVTPPTTALARNSDATWDSTNLEIDLTPASDDKRGSAWVKTTIPSAAAIDVSFTLEISGGDGASGADGMAFCLLDGRAATTTIGDTGGLLGIDNMSARSANCVVFDTWDNGGDDPSANYVGSKTADTSAGGGFALSDSAAYGTPSFDLNAATPAEHYVSITYRPISSGSTATLAAGIATGTTSATLSSMFSTTITPVYTSLYPGWAAATGGANNLHIVDNAVVTCY